MDNMVSVVIPFYTNYVWLAEAIDSVLSQSYKNFEIIVVNDGSPEDDTSFLAQYGEKINYRKYPNQGPAKARNIGIEQARGTYVAFLDSDDLWTAEKLMEQVTYMDQTQRIWSHTSYTLFNDATRQPIRDVRVGHFSGNVFTRCLVSSPIATPTVMIRRDFLAAHPDVRFSETMRYGQDGFMWLNVANSAPLGSIDTTLAGVRMRGQNAALRARAYLQVKAQLWSFIAKKIKDGTPNYRHISMIIKWIYRLSYHCNKLLLWSEATFKLSARSSEFLARLLYLPIYLLLKAKNLLNKK